MPSGLSGDDSASPATAQARGRGRLILLGCWLLLAVLGWLDDITGYEMSFFVFYSVPVGAAAWWLGRRPAIVLALGATVTWLLADYLSGEKYSARFYYYWNGTIHFLAFMINAVTIAKIKNDLDRRQVLAVELESTRAALRAVTALLPACPGCGRPRKENAHPQQADVAALAREQPELAGALCAECKGERRKGVDAAGQPVGLSARA
jgi:hypothetical protein